MDQIYDTPILTLVQDFITGKFFWLAFVDRARIPKLSNECWINHVSRFILCVVVNLAPAYG